MANNVNVKKLEADLWESADLLRAGSKLTSNQYCMPVLGLIFLRYAYSRFKLVEQEILKDRPMRGGRVLPVEQSDFAEKSALFLPKEAQYNYLVNLPANIPEQGLTGIEGNPLNSLGEVVNNAMELVEQQSEQLQGVLPKDYTIFSSHIHQAELGIVLHLFLSVEGHGVVGDHARMVYKVAGLHKHTAAAASRVQQNAVGRLQHIDDHLDQGLGREEHAIVLSDVFGKLIEEVLIDAANDIAAHLVQRTVVEDAE